MSSVVLYRYNSSPFSWKADRMLLLKNIPHKTVDVSMMLPRPEISDLLGITYRRIPILAVGNDVYCDTSLIATALERHFPESAGYGTLFPPNKSSGNTDGTLMRLVSKHVADDVLFPLAPAFLPWDQFPKQFLKDRSKMVGKEIDPSANVKMRGPALATLSSYLALIEQQLQDGRKWLFDTEAPSLADISVHFVFQWVQSMGSADSLFDKTAFPHALEWITRLSTYLEELKAKRTIVEKINGDQAADLIISSNHLSYDTIGFDNAQAAQLGLRQNQQVQIAPVDTGRNYPTVGKLVAFNKEEVVIEVQGKKGLLRCHFPRLGFFIMPVAPGSKL